MGDPELEAAFPVSVPKSNVWTYQHRYPRTTHNVEFRDWAQDPSCPSKNHYLEPRKSLQFPIPPLKRFRPMIEMAPEEDLKLRLTIFEPRGRKTPVEAFHYGYRKFSLDPATKTLRNFDDPLPHPLHTIKRESYTNPGDRPHLKCPQNYLRYGLTPRTVACGAAPLVHVVAPPWSEDTLFAQRMQKEKLEQQRQKNLSLEAQASSQQ